ncbi:MAG: TonB-dependent receptor [Sulfuricella sp.]
MRRRTLSIALALAFSNAAMAEDSATSNYLLDDLGEQTRIATRTKLNIDYAPGTISILHSDNLLAHGARTVWEALALVPGFEMSMDETGTRQVLVRGVGRTYSSGNIKLLLNDVALNSELLSLANPLLNMPVEQVERIEVIRGPGSVIYGESAYMGVVNVITRKQGQRVFAALGDKGAAAGGGVLAMTDAERQFDMSLNVAAWKQNGGGLHAGEDAGYAEGFGAFSNAPGLANDKYDYKSALFNLNFQKFSLSAQWLEDGAGDHFGINSYLPPNERRIVTRQRHRSLEAKQLFELNNELQAEFRLGWGDYTRQRDRMFLYPVGVYDPYYYMDLNYREQRTNAALDVAWEKGRNTWQMGWVYTSIEVEQANSTFNGMPTSNWLDLNMKRNISSFTLQDQFRATDALTITAGLRHDRYNDVGSSTTPRLAAVWQAAPGHVFKAQYAEAFRAPTFYELRYGGQIEPEVIATRELGYTYRQGGGLARITAFDSTLKQQIVFDENLGYLNLTGTSSSRGVELEVERWLGSALKMDGNLTLIRTEDKSSGQPVPGAANRLLNLGMEWHPASELTVDLRLRHVGPRQREAGDLREKLAGYNTVDLTATTFNFGSRGLTLRAGIKNLFNQTVKVPSTIDIFMYPAPNYREDMPMLEGRNAWAQLTYSF